MTHALVRRLGRRWAERIGEPAEFVIDETFGVPGVGTVVAGTLKKGTIGPNATLLLGPDIADGAFRPVAVKSLHYKRLPVAQASCGTAAMKQNTFATLLYERRT